MQDDIWQAFSGRVSCEESLHVDSEPLAWPLPQARAWRLIERNTATLAAIAALEERRAETGDDDNPLNQEIVRLDAKLTALVDIVNRLLVPDDALPPRQLLRFNALGAVVPAALLPAGEAVLLRLRFDACRSLPLELAGQVDRRLGHDQVFVAFIPLGDTLGEAIERLVFRHHRRRVAETRQSGA